MLLRFLAARFKDAAPDALRVTLLLLPLDTFCRAGAGMITRPSFLAGRVLI